MVRVISDPALFAVAVLTHSARSEPRSFQTALSEPNSQQRRLTVPWSLIPIS